MSKNRFFWIAALVGLFLDHLTKFWVVQNLPLCENLPMQQCSTWALWSGVFHFTYVRNKGAAWSLFEGAFWLPWLSLIVSIGLMALAWFGSTLDRWEQVGWGFILAGALGNGIDRFVAGSVVDFLDFRLIQFPVFNLADVFINMGIICLLIASFRKPQPGGDSHPK